MNKTFDTLVSLPDDTSVTCRATWSYSSGTPGTLSDSPGWELLDFWVIGHPRLSLEEREHVKKQLSPP